MPHDAKGVYMDLLCHSWDIGPLPVDLAASARFVGMTPARFRRMWTDHLAAKWTQGESGFVNGRLENIRAGLGGFQQRQAAKAVKRWKKDAAAAPVAVPGDMPGECYTHSQTHPQEDQTHTAPSALAVAFDVLWTIYPNKSGKKAAQRAWAKANPTDAVIRSISDALVWQVRQPSWVKNGGQFVPMLATYLNGRRWEDEPTHAASTQPFHITGPKSSWFDECEALHKGECLTSWAHGTRMTTEKAAS